MRCSELRDANWISRRSMNNRRTRTALILLPLLAVALLAVLYVQLPAIKDLYRIDDDFRQHFWMARFQDPDVFSSDPIFYDVKRVHVISFLGIELILRLESIGFSLMYQLASYLVAPLVFSKLLPFIVMAVCVVYLFALGRLLTESDSVAAFLVLLFVIYGLSASPNISVTSGLERSFQFVLLIMFLYYLVSDSALGIVVTLVAQVLFYMPMFIVSTVVGVLSLLRWRGGRVGVDLTARRIWPLVVGVVLAALILLPAVLDGRVVTNPLSDKDIQMPVWQDPNYGPKGRVPIFPESFSGFPSFLLAGYGGLARLDDWWYMTPLVLLAVIILV